jgi:hypothetical protein
LALLGHKVLLDNAVLLVPQAYKVRSELPDYKDPPAPGPPALLARPDYLEPQDKQVLPVAAPPALQELVPLEQPVLLDLPEPQVLELQVP